MTCNYKLIRNAALSFVMAGGMAGFATLAHAQSYSRSEVRDAQRQLKKDGYYTGSIDGIDGPMTMAAIRNYQHDNQLAISGQLDHQTVDKLGIHNVEEANRETTAPAPSYALTPSKATVKAAQRKLEDSGFYSGKINGTFGPKTHAAVRDFQEDSQLNPTGQLDQATLVKLGVAQ